MSNGVWDRRTIARPRSAEGGFGRASLPSPESESITPTGGSPLLIIGRSRMMIPTSSTPNHREIADEPKS